MNCCFEDQSLLKEQSRGQDNYREALFNPGCWPKDAIVGIEVIVNTSAFINCITKFFPSNEAFMAWMTEPMSNGSISHGSLVCWPLKSVIDDAGILVDSAVHF